MVSPAPSLEPCFLPGPQDPPPEQYAVVSCYTGTLQVGPGKRGRGAVRACPASDRAPCPGVKILLGCSLLDGS